MTAQLTEWLLENGFLVLLGIFLFWHRKIVYEKFIFTPLAGGNGKIQMDELMKGIIAVMFIWAMHRDGHRKHEWAYFSDVFYASLLAAVCAIAGLKEYLRAKNNDNKESN